MKRVRLRSAAGTLELWLAREELRDAALELAARVLAPAPDSARASNRTERPAPRAEELVLGGRRAWLKCDFLAGRARLRHAAARCLLGRPPPRAQEAANLEWLGERLFQAPEPLAAGWLGGSAPRAQFLATAFVEGPPLDRWLADHSRGDRRGDPRGERRGERARLLAELARETARLHALHFVHRDLHLRNLLVGPPDAPRRLWWIDAWRGGEGPQLRGRAYDLATLFLEGASLLEPAEIREWLALYAAERAELGAPIDRAGLFGAATRARARLVARVAREPGRWRLPGAPVQAFDFADAAR